MSARYIKFIDICWRYGLVGIRFITACNPNSPVCTPLQNVVDFGPMRTLKSRLSAQGRIKKTKQPEKLICNLVINSKTVLFLSPKDPPRPPRPRAVWKFPISLCSDTPNCSSLLPLSPSINRLCYAFSVRRRYVVLALSTGFSPMLNSHLKSRSDINLKLLLL